MAKEVNCPSCGELLRGEDDDAYVATAQRHAKSMHDSEPPRHYILAHGREVV